MFDCTAYCVQEEKTQKGLPGPASTEEKMRRQGTLVLKKIVGLFMRNAKKARREMENAFARFKKPVSGAAAGTVSGDGQALVRDLAEQMRVGCVHCWGAC